MGNPQRELQEQTDKLRQLLDQADGEDFSDVPIDGAAVFLNPEVQLTVKDPVIPALRTNQVKDFVRRKAKEVKLQTSQLRSLSSYLQENMTLGEETEAYLSALRAELPECCEIWKAVRVKDALPSPSDYPSAQRLLLDGRQELQTQNAAQTPILELSVADGRLNIEHRNLKQAVVNSTE